MALSTPIMDPAWTQVVVLVGSMPMIPLLIVRRVCLLVQLAYLCKTVPAVLPIHHSLNLTRLASPPVLTDISLKQSTLVISVWPALLHA